MDRLRAMEAFVKTVETGALSSAAQHLGLANASVTTLIRRLEEELGVTLLQRSTRHIRLTEQGATYYARCRAILEQVAEADAAVAAPGDGPSGVLRLETPIAVGHLLLGPALAAFSRLHPRLRVVTTLNNEVGNLIKRGVDVAIRMQEVESAELVARLIYRAPYGCYAAPGFLAEHGTPGHPRDLPPRQCLGLVGGSAGRLRVWAFRGTGEEVEITPDGSLFFNSTDALVQAAAHGAGFIYVLDVLAAQAERRGELVRLFRDWRTEEQTFYAAYVKSAFTPEKVRAVVGFLAEHFAAPRDTPPVPVRR
jgi:LysR family transcriptional regulator for bpeEF and oprC